MAGTHEGYSLGMKANYAQIEEAKKATTALYSTLGDVERRAKNLHMGATLPREINHIDTVTASYIRRLESEGKTYEANKQKVNAYQGAISELSKKQNELRSALDQAKNATDRNSDAYRTQQIRFNENVAEINRYKAGLKGVNEEMRHANPNFWDKVKSHLHDTNTEAEKTHSIFKSVFSANLVSNAVTGGLNLVKNNIGGMIRSAHEYNVQQQTMNATWLTLTGNAQKGKAMVNQIDNMAAAAQNDTKMVDTLSQKFYAINKSPQQTAQITKSVLTLQDAFGATDDAVEGFGTQFSQMMANQKVSAQDMMSFVNVFPEYRMQLLRTVDKQQHTKLSMKQMNAEMSNGKISSKVAIDALEDMAHHYKSATGNFTKTIPGMIRTVKSQMPRLMSAFDRPFTKAENPIIKQVSDWSSSKKTQSAFSHLGLVVSHGMNEVMKTAFSSGGHHQKTVGQVLNSGIYKVAGATKKFFSYLAIHGKDIKDIGKSAFSIASTIGKGVWKDFSAIAVNIGKAFGLIGKNADKHGGTLHALAQGLDNLSKHKTALKAVSDYIVLVASIKGVSRVTSPLISLGTKGVRTYQVVHGISSGLRGITDAQKISKMGELETHFFNIGKGARDAAKAIGDFGSKIGISSLFGGKAAAKVGPQAVLDATAKGNRKWFTAPLESMKHARGFKNLTAVGKIANVGAGVGVAIDAGSQFFNAYKDRHNADKRSQDIGQGIGSAIGGGIGMYFGGPLGAMIGSQLGKVAGKWGGTAVNHFTKGWQKHKPPKKFWSMENLGWSTHNMFKQIGSGWNHFWGGLHKGWNHFGSALHKGWKNSIKESHNFFKSLPGNMSKFGKSMQRNWNGTWKAVNNNRYVKAFKQGKFMQTAAKDIQSRWQSFSTDFGKKWNAGWSSFNNARYVKAFKKGEFFSTALKDIQSRWQSFSTDFGKKWNGFWGGLGKGWNHFWGGMGDWAKKHGNNLKAFGNDLDYARGGSGKAFKYTKIKGHANGGLMHSTHGALVGENGPELAYRPYASHVRLLGANGPEITKVHSGEHILNAHDTARVMFGGLGHGMVLRGYANGTENLGKTKKTVTDDYKQIADKSSKSLNKLSKKSKNTWSAITRQTGKDTSKLSKLSRNTWSKIVSQTGKDTSKLSKTSGKTWSKIASLTGSETSKTQKTAISHYSDMRIGIHKQMGKMHDGVISLSNSTAKGFGKALGKTKGFAQNAMKDTIGQINKGISGIDKVLGQFGGNTSVIKPVKFATGTDSNGRLTRDTYAMVNDATSGPRQEALVSDKNEIFMPRGNNVKMMIPKGWGVLNGIQTLQAGLQHFAKGSGLSHSALRKLAEKAGANPVQSFKDMFLSQLKPSKTDFGRGSTNLASNSGKHFGNPWSAAMWTVINNAIGGGTGKGGTREAFLKYAQSTFSGVPYLMGAMSKAASDCSAMIAQALKHFGLDAGRSTVDMQHSSSLHYLGKNLSSTIPGDLVIFGHGTGAAGHVGIVKNPQTGTMFNETPPHARVTRIADDMGMGYGFYRVKGLHNASASKKTVKSDKRLETLAKHELGSSALKWIKDKLGDEGSLGGNIGGEGVKRWGGTVKRILGMLHLSTSTSMVDRVLRQISTESGGNPNARQPGVDPDGDGSGPALGLMQTKRMTFNAFKRKGSGGIFNGPANIYAGLNYAMHRYGPSLSSLGNGHGYAKGGKPTAHTPFIAGEHGPELITADGPVKVDTHEQTKHKLSDLVNIVRSPKVNRPTHTNKQAPIININFNGPIGGSVKDAKKIAEIVKREITQYLINIGDEFGTDPSLY